MSLAVLAFLALTGRVDVHRGGADRPWIGQLVPVDVAIIRPQAEPPLEPPSVDEVTMDGAITLWSAEAPPPSEREENGTKYLVQRRRLLVFPQRSGTLALPAIRAHWHDASTDEQRAAQSAPLRFEAAAPPGAEDDPPLVASAVTLTESFDREPEGLAVGDGFTRTLTLSARDSDAIVFPTFTFASSSGLAAYPAEPKTRSTSERGAFVSERETSVTYVVQRAGPQAIPAVAVRWLEPASGTFAIATAPRHRFFARPNPSLGFQCLGTAPGARTSLELSAVTFLVAGVALFVRRWRRKEQLLPIQKGPSEAHAFRVVLRSARSDRGISTLRSLYRWLQILWPDAVAPTLRDLAKSAPDARDELERLDASLYGQTPQSWHHGGFLATLQRARRRIRSAKPAIAHDLNPTECRDSTQASRRSSKRA
jgi:hypothetical protein